MVRLITGHSSTIRKPSISTDSRRAPGSMASVSDLDRALLELVGAGLPGEEPVERLGGLQLRHLPVLLLGEDALEMSTSPSRCSVRFCVSSAAPAGPR